MGKWEVSMIQNTNSTYGVVSILNHWLREYIVLGHHWHGLLYDLTATLTPERADFDLASIALGDFNWLDCDQSFMEVYDTHAKHHSYLPFLGNVVGESSACFFIFDFDRRAFVRLVFEQCSW